MAVGGWWMLGCWVLGGGGVVSGCWVGPWAAGGLRAFSRLPQTTSHRNVARHSTTGRSTPLLEILPPDFSAGPEFGGRTEQATPPKLTQPRRPC